MPKFGFLDSEGHEICRLLVHDMAVFKLVRSYLFDMSGQGVASDGCFDVHDGTMTLVFSE